MATLRLAFLVMVAVMTTSIAFVAAQESPGPLGTWSVQNKLNQELFLQCSSDLGDMKLVIVPALGYKREVWYPEANAYLLCTVYTGRPAHYGSYNLYVRNPAFRGCYKDCSWVVDESGLTLVSEGGLKYRTHYDWQRKGD